MSGVLSSWSRRRAAVAAEAAAEEQAALDAVVMKDAAALEEKSDAEILQELNLPDPMTLVQGDDFKAFMSKEVPAHLRKIALRKLWTSNPVLACVDGLNDYDDDYLTGSTGQGAIKTTYQVGKGMLAHLIEVERQKNEMHAAEAEIEEHDIVADDTEVEVEVLEAETPDVQPAAHDDEPASPAPRRMQFQFEDRTA
ncbi:DUF3306 domain-containing protein [Sulfitobacter sp. SK011]|uniref:DUF3306 domain-containing protein n=1 Tax=Sulfitobacter sp. SK011 TaxID=1389004 RepID=UPI000E0B90E5|nr:DUF3306 domain-containing protein [Sulfitobacter sp. SK011]AXI43199.1 DUF3306 domain-containing protein [Sulfitobacter sp. SK011]